MHLRATASMCRRALGGASSSSSTDPGRHARATAICRRALGGHSGLNSTDPGRQCRAGPLPTALMSMADAELGRMLVPDSVARRQHQGRVLAPASVGKQNQGWGRQGRVLVTTPACNRHQGQVLVTMASSRRREHQLHWVLAPASATGNQRRQGWGAIMASAAAQRRAADGGQWREQCGHLREYLEGRTRPATAAVHMEGWLRTRPPSFAAVRHSARSGRGIR